MKTGFPHIVVALLLSSTIGCTTIYQSVKDKRDKNYQQGIDLFNQNKAEEAHEHFKIVVDIDPDYRDAKAYLTRTERLVSLKKKQIKQKANRDFDNGVALMKNGQYEIALNYLLAAQQEDPDIPDLKFKIEECRKKLAIKLNHTMKQAEQLYNRKQYIQAYSLCLKMNVYDPSNSEVNKLQSKIEDKLDEQAKNYRLKGQEYYSKKQYSDAQKQLQIALNFYPWDKESAELLNKVNNRLNLDNYYSNAVYMYNNGNYFGAKTAFAAVNGIEPGYKSSAQYLSKANAALSKQAPALFNSGVALYDNGNYRAAITEFDKVLSVNPNHAMALEYRQRSQSKLNIQKSLQGGGVSK